MIFTPLLMSASPEAEHQVQCAQRLDAVIGYRSYILQLLASEDPAGLVRRDVLERFAVTERASIIKVELVWRDALLVLDFRLDVRGRASILKRLAGDVQAALVRRDAPVLDFRLDGRDVLLVLDFGLDIGNGVRGFDVQGDGLARCRLNEEDLHGPGDVRL